MRAWRWLSGKAARTFRRCCWSMGTNVNLSVTRKRPGKEGEDTMPLRCAKSMCYNESGLCHIQLLLEFGAGVDPPLPSIQNNSAPCGGQHSGSLSARPWCRCEHNRATRAKPRRSIPMIWSTSSFLLNAVLHWIACLATNGNTILHHVARDGLERKRVAKLRDLLPLGLNKYIDTPNNNGLAPLHLDSAYRRNQELAMLLWQHGANISAIETLRAACHLSSSLSVARVIGGLRVRIPCHKPFLTVGKISTLQLTMDRRRCSWI